MVFEKPPEQGEKSNKNLIWLHRGWCTQVLLLPLVIPYYGNILIHFPLWLYTYSNVLSLGPSDFPLKDLVRKETCPYFFSVGKHLTCEVVLSLKHNPEEKILKVLSLKTYTMSLWPLQIFPFLCGFYPNYNAYWLDSPYYSAYPVGVKW